MHHASQDHAPRTPRRRVLSGALAFTSAALSAACQPAVPTAEAGTPSEPAPMPVAVARVTTTAIAVGSTQMARVEAAQRVELRPRVTGTIVAVLFREGDLVREGQPLFQIDPRPFQIAVSRARADLNLARAREATMGSEAARARQLHASQAMALEEMERRAAAHAEARARLDAAEAMLQAAQLELDFSLVRSPIAGRAGRALVTPGNIVGSTPGATPLTTLISDAPLHVHFDVADRLVLTQLGRRHMGQDHDSVDYEEGSITLGGAVAMGAGVMIGAGIFALTGQIAELAGPAFPLAFAVGAIISGFSAYSYVKMSNAWPSSGGIAMILQ